MVWLVKYFIKKYGLFVFIVVTMIGCKPKQIINERVITRVDSSAVLRLQEQLDRRSVELDNYKNELQRARDENMLLRQEVSSHTINYDTNAPLKPDGTYPIASEIKTETKSTLEKKLSETESENKELRSENITITQHNRNLQYEVEQLLNENRSLKAKIIPVTLWQKIKGYVYGCLIGMVIGALLWWRIGKLIIKN